jgi:hypothetical protein
MRVKFKWWLGLYMFVFDALILNFDGKTFY